MSNFEIATLDLREKPGVLAGFSKSQFKITDFEIGSLNKPFRNKKPPGKADVPDGFFCF
jgi:hypothetical protein